MPGALDLIGKTIRGVSDIGYGAVKGIGGLAGGTLEHIGTGLKSVRDAKRADLRQPQLLNDIRKIQAAGGVSTEAGRKMLAEMSGKYSADMFKSPYETARTKYWSEGGRSRIGSPKSELYKELEYWQGQLKATIDPRGFGVETDPKTGEVTGGILNKKVYDTATEHINRITGEITQMTGTPEAGMTEVGTKGAGAGLYGDTVYGEDVPEEYRRLGVKRYTPPGGGWAGGFGGADSYEQLLANRGAPPLREPGAFVGPPAPARQATPYRSTATQGVLMSEISRLKGGDGMIIGDRRAGEIVSKYPTVSQYLKQSTPEEVQQILDAIEIGMTEREILRALGG